ncbi:MAG: hypothetical protein F4Z00_05290 [Acidimicrobiaceae bacterium]|nr:hypothetical protein [Acidimicrobiaceae bacterium]MXZ64950.1 hypothetical protein [Acidimicrobiaceae bacterium]MYF33436.1 hypothetical protein [Acidimicrobiaceae bacterium]MYG79952.1 hypothetical protein [Acidimicrobiaceae bacterium]MYJ82585.1 hypothetical protein [Acidimicrobiaceae bacterium]
MPALNVPDAYAAALLSLHEIDDDEFAAVLDAIDVLRGPSGISAFARAAGASAQIGEQTAETLLQVVLSIVDHGERQQGDPDDLIAEIVASPDLGLDEPSQARLLHRVQTLVGSSPTRLFHKSLLLLQEHDSVFVDTKIVTDIRPVFGDDISDGAETAVLTHSLKIEFFRAGRRDHFYVALDHDDLLSMKEAIDRAIAKTASLTKTLRSAGISTPTLEG